MKMLENSIVLSSQPEAAIIALNELQKIDPNARGVRLSPEIQLISNFCMFGKFDKFDKKLCSTIFIRHIFPVQFTCNLSTDSHTFSHALLELCLCQNFPKEQVFSIQMRNLSTDRDSSVSFEYPRHIENSLIEMGYIKNDSAPIWVLSLLIHNEILYAGASYCKDNLSSWNGGKMRFKKDSISCVNNSSSMPFISRAEFKLLEALSVFDDVTGDKLAQAKYALDLGAAPGGWSKVLLEHVPGLEVTAVDPAALEENIAKHPRLRHIKDIAQRFVVADKKDGIDRKFDIIVNDMRMDMMDSARIMLDLYHMLADDGIVIMTLKLPHNQWYKNTKRTCILLEKSYRILGARQLFHNRSEVTIVASH